MQKNNLWLPSVIIPLELPQVQKVPRRMKTIFLFNTFPLPGDSFLTIPRATCRLTNIPQHTSKEDILPHRDTVSALLTSFNSDHALYASPRFPVLHPGE